MKFIKTSLQQFIVCHIFKIFISTPVDFVHWNYIRMHNIQELASDGALLTYKRSCIHPFLLTEAVSSIFSRFSSRVEFNQSIISFLPTKKAPSIIPMFDIFSCI